MSQRSMTDRLIEECRKLYPHQQVNCPWGEIEQRIRQDASLFRRALHKVRRYAKRNSIESSLNLWNACHVFDLMVSLPFCFYCGKRFTKEEFMTQEVQLEHFIPRSKPYVPPAAPFDGRLRTPHHPHRIVLACASCNRIKSNLVDADIQQIISDPDGFFAKRRYRPDRREQLSDFAEIFYWFIAAPRGYASRHGLEFSFAQAHWEKRRKKYRQRWLVSENSNGASRVASKGRK